MNWQKNIVEHSGQGENDGQGMITIRAYSKSETDKTKVLETHVFDYGERGVFQTLFDNTSNLKDSHPKYNEDLKILNKDYRFEDFVSPKEKILYQQFFLYPFLWTESWTLLNNYLSFLFEKK